MELFSGSGQCAQWRFVPAGDRWLLQNRDSGLNLRNADGEGDGTPVELWSGTGDRAQWEVVASSEAGYVHLRNVRTGLNVRNAGCEDVSDETPVELWDGTGNCARWRLEAVGDYARRRACSPRRRGHRP